MTETRPPYNLDGIRVTFDLPDFDAIAARYDAANAPKPPGSVELCRCGAEARHKVVEEIDNRSLHALGVYLCHGCFVALMGPAADIPFPPGDPDLNWSVDAYNMPNWSNSTRLNPLDSMGLDRQLTRVARDLDISTDVYLMSRQDRDHILANLNKLKTDADSILAYSSHLRSQLFGIVVELEIVAVDLLERRRSQSLDEIAVQISDIGKRLMEMAS